MNCFLLNVLLLTLFSCVFGGLIISGDNDAGYNMVNNDKKLYDFIEIHPHLTVGLNFTSISQNYPDSSYGAAITAQRVLYSWGADQVNLGASQNIKNVTTASPVIAISASSSHVLYVQSDKKVYCYGNNNRLNCGNDNTCTMLAPCLFGDGTLNGTKVYSGYQFSYVLTENGVIYAAGDNDVPRGHLGVNAIDGTISPPRPVVGAIGGKTAVKVSFSDSHGVALDIDGNLYSWGLNANGQLGDGTTTDTIFSVVANITGLDGESIIDFTASVGCTIMVTSSGKIFAIGNYQHPIFAGEFSVNQLLPVLVAHHNYIQGKVKQISSTPAISNFVSFLTDSGDIYACGETVFNGTIQFAQRIPFDKKFIGMTGNLLSVSEDGKIYGIGLNENGFIITNFIKKRMEDDVYDDISFLPRIVESGIDSGSDDETQKTFVAVTKQGVVYGAGRTDTGKLGVDPNSLKNSEKFAYPFLSIASNDNFDNSGISEAAVSGKHITLLKGNTLFATGEFSGTTTNPTNQVVPVNMSVLNRKTIKHIYPASSTTVVLTTDNQIYYFGHDIFNGDSPSTSLELQLLNTTIMGNQTIKDVQCGTKFCLFQTEEGNVYGSGDNTQGQLATGDRINSFNSIVQSNLNSIQAPIVEISTGAFHTLYFTADGLVYGAGSNRNTQLGFKNFFSKITLPTKIINNTGEYDITAEVSGAKKIAAGALISLVLTNEDRFLIYGYYQNLISINTYNFKPLPETPLPTYIDIPLLPNENITTISIRPRTIFIFTEFICFGVSSSKLNVCSGNGKCENLNQCSCTNGYIGEDCSIPVCFGKNASDSDVCSSQGICSSADNCTCDSGYTGTECEIPICFDLNATDSRVCSGNGNCTSKDTCNCRNSFTGEKCLFPICFGKNSTDPTVCSGKGTCGQPENCTCDVGYSGIQCELQICFGKISDDATVCSGNGICIQPENCTCSSGFSGNECEFHSCFGKNSTDANGCSGNGDCSTLDNCTCNSGYSGKQCEFTNCYGKNSSDPAVCSKNGDCASFNKCDCVTGFSGNECEFHSCFGTNFTDTNACSGNGVCSSLNNCTCNSGYSGNQCKFTNCYGKNSSDSNVCSGNGNCTSLDNCTCKFEYSGDQCEIKLPTCFGKLSNDANVCSSHGICISNDNCSCSSTGYFGSECQFIGCYGKNISDPNICSGNGDCSSVNNCTCSSQFSGNNCQNAICFNKPSNEPSVCNGRGKCDSPNNCICNNGYSGDQCENTIPIHNCKSVGENQIDWTIEGNITKFKIQFRPKASFSSSIKWAAIGLNKNPNEMEGASIIMGYPGNVNEYTATGFSQPTLSGTQRISNFSVVASGKDITITFTRPNFDINDSNYFAIKNESQSLMISYNVESTPTSPESFSQHTFATSQVINLFESSKCDIASSSTKVVFSMIAFLVSWFVLLF